MEKSNRYVEIHWENIFAVKYKFLRVNFIIGNELGEYKDFIYEPNFNLFPNGSLKFLHVTKQNEGHYMCEAKNEIGSGVSKVIFLKVNSKYFRYNLLKFG